jgi:hypothetical protein
MDGNNDTCNEETKILINAPKPMVESHGILMVGGCNRDW